MKGTARLLLAFLVMAGMIPVVHAQQIHGRMRQTWTRLSDDTQAGPSDTVTQDYQLSFRNLVARNLSWQTRLRALLRGFNQEDGNSSSDVALFEPFLQVVYESPSWVASGGTRMNRITPKGSRSDAIERERRDFFARLGWTGEIAKDHNLNVSWSGYRLELEEADVDQNADDRSILQAAWLTRTSQVTLGVENRGFEDLLTGFTRDSTEVTTTGNFRHTFRRARLTVSGRALLAELNSTENTPAAQDILVKRDPRAGLFGVDLTPLDSILPDAPGLVDGDLTGVVADLDGRDRNLGVDMGFPKRLERAFIHLERRLTAGNEDEYRWEIYTSGDGDTWVLHQAVTTFVVSCSSLKTASGVYCFEPLRNRFELKFSPVQARFLKVVNTAFSTAEVPLGVTELEVLDMESRVGSAEFDSSRQSGNLSLGWRPGRDVNMSVHLLGGQQSNKTPSGEQEEKDWSTTFTTAYRPGKLSTIARVQAINRSSTDNRPERDRVLSVTLAGSPVPDLDLSATGTRRRNSVPGGLLFGNDSVNLRTAARLASHTQTSLDVAFTRQDQRETRRVTNRRTGHVAIVTTLRPGLLLTNDWTVIRLKFEADDEIPSRTDYDMRVRLSYRPTSVFGGSLEYLYQDVAGREGASRLLDLDWLPFPGGALQLQFTVVRDRLGQTGAILDEERGALRWTLNPRTIVESSYAVQRRGDGTTEFETRTISGFLEFRF